MPSKNWVVTPRQRYDLEMMLIGGFSPVSQFHSQADYHSVLSHMRLVNKQIWPIPITMDVNTEFAEATELGHEILLCDVDNNAPKLVATKGSCKTKYPYLN